MEKKLVTRFYKDFKLTESDLPVSCLEFNEIPPRVFLFNQKTKANKLFFLLEGKALLGKNLYSEKEHILDLILSPSIVGLDSVRLNDNYSVYIKSLTELKYVQIDSYLFNLLCQKNHKLRHLINKQLSHRLLHAENKYVQLSGNLVFLTRIKNFLVDLFSNHGEKKGSSVVIQIQITHKELAQYMHASRQSITTLLNTLRRERIIEYDRSKLVLFSMEKLVRFDFNTN